MCSSLFRFYTAYDTMPRGPVHMSAEARSSIHSDMVHIGAWGCVIVIFANANGLLFSGYYLP
jgi:hypothetical protein